MAGEQASPRPGRNVASSDPGPIARTVGQSTDGAKVVPPTSVQIVPGSYQPPLEDIASIDGDIIIHGECLIKGGSYDILGTGYFADTAGSGGLGIIHGGVLLLEPSLAVNPQPVQVWGPGKLFLEDPLSAVENLSGTTWQTILTIGGGITISSLTTATKYVTGTWTDGVNITPANLDTFNGLQNPRTGSRFSTN